MSSSREPYRYQYSHGNMYRRNRQKPPKRKKGKRIFTILLAIALLAGGFWFFTRSDNPVSSLTDSITKKVEKKPEPPKPKLDKTLQAKLSEWAASQDGGYGISVREINGTMRYASYQADQSFVPASTFKPFVAYTILYNIEQGQYTLQDTTYKGNTIEYCMDRMITISDNDCAYQLERKAGFVAMDTFLHEQGFTSTNLNNYDANGRMLSTDKQSTAADEAELLWRLQKGTLLNQVHTDYLIGLMKNQQWRERIPAGVAEGIEVADKPGWLPGIEADMAIVYGTKSTYILTILSTDTLPSNLANLSALVYDYLNDVESADTD